MIVREIKSNSALCSGNSQSMTITKVIDFIKFSAAVVIITYQRPTYEWCNITIFYFYSNYACNCRISGVKKLIDLISPSFTVSYTAQLRRNMLSHTVFHFHPFFSPTNGPNSCLCQWFDRLFRRTVKSLSAWSQTQTQQKRHPNAKRVCPKGRN